MAVAIFVMMKKIFECVDCLLPLVTYFGWVLLICLKFGGIIVFYSRIGDVVSYEVESSHIILLTFCRFHF